MPGTDVKLGIEGTDNPFGKLKPHAQVTWRSRESTAERYTLADPDVRLMLRVRDDDARAFEELMLRYQNAAGVAAGAPDRPAGRRRGPGAGRVSARVPGAEAVRAGGEVFDVAVHDRGQRGGQLAAEPVAAARSAICRRRPATRRRCRSKRWPSPRAD